MKAKQVLPSLGHTLLCMLTKPKKTMATITPNLVEGFLVVVVLIVIAGGAAAVGVYYSAGVAKAGFAVFGATIGIIMAWVSLTILFHFIARLMSGTGRFLNLLSLIGYAATPMILSTIIGIITNIVSPVLFPNLSSARLDLLGLLIGWIGMAFGWPGINFNLLQSKDKQLNLFIILKYL